MNMPSLPSRGYDVADVDTTKEAIDLDDMLAQIVAKLHARPAAVKKLSLDVVPSATADTGYAKEAVRLGNVGLAKAFLRLASDNTNSFFAIKAAYDELADCGVDNPEQYLSPQTVHTYISLWNEMMDIKGRSPEVDNRGILCFAMMSGDEDCQIIARIVAEREPATVHEVRELLAETKSCTSGLSSGVL
jgi:hypothetical protein